MANDRADHDRAATIALALALAAAAAGLLPITQDGDRPGAAGRRPAARHAVHRADGRPGCPWHSLRLRNRGQLCGPQADTRLPGRVFGGFIAVIGDALRVSDADSATLLVG